MYRNKGSLWGGGISVDVHSGGGGGGGGGIVEYLPLLYFVIGSHGYRRAGVTVVASVMVALAALRGGIGLGVVGRARVLGG